MQKGIERQRSSMRENENISAARSEEEQAIRQLLFECTENFTSLSTPVD
jgi:hypothetical protein